MCFFKVKAILSIYVYIPQDASFEIAHVEVWGLGPPVDADEERQKVRPRQPNLQIRAGDVDEDDLLSQLMWTDIGILCGEHKMFLAAW